MGNDPARSRAAFGRSTAMPRWLTGSRPRHSALRMVLLRASSSPAPAALLTIILRWLQHLRRRPGLRSAPGSGRGLRRSRSSVVPDGTVVNVRAERRLTPEQERSPLQDPELRRFFERFFGEQLPDGMPPPRATAWWAGARASSSAPEGYVVGPAYHVAGGADGILGHAQ